MEDSDNVQYDAHDYTRAGKIAAHLAKGGYDLSLSERSALRQAADILKAWAGTMPRERSAASRQKA
jgi:hypothetical protein